MRLDKASHWVTIVGNLGLLIGVALVIFQINQNSELMRDQLSHATFTDRLNLQLAMMGENPAVAVSKAIQNPTELTLEDSRIVDAYLQYWALVEVRSILMEERGMLDGAPKSFTPSDPSYTLDLHTLGIPYLKAHYEVNGFGPHLGPRLEHPMETLTGNEAFERYERMLVRLKLLSEAN